MSDTLEITFYDLIPEAQVELLEFYGLETEEDGNFEYSPIAILEKGD